MKDKEKRLSKLKFRHSPQSAPTSPATASNRDTPAAPLNLTRVISGSSRRKRSPSHTASTGSTSKFGFEGVDSILKPKINRTASAGSRAGSVKRQFTLDDPNIGSIPPAPTSTAAGTPMAASPTTAQTPGVLTPKMSMSRVSSNAGITPTFQPPKSKFKMAHESFRNRMFQEQYGLEPVFMTKKRTDNKSSEFKGGDLNKYTSRSYTVKNGNEVFGDCLQL